MKNRYNRHNRRKYMLKVHIVFATKFRKKLFFGAIDQTLKQKCQQLADRYKWKIIAMETDKDHIHILLEYDTTESVSSIAQKLKQCTTYTLWKEHSQILSQHYWKKKHYLWSDSYFACSAGEVSSAMIQAYIESQG